MTTTRTLTSLRIYWDSQNPNNEGWAYSVGYEDDHEDTGPWDMRDDATADDVRSAVIELAWQHDMRIESHDVHVDMHTDGGFGTWIGD